MLWIKPLLDTNLHSNRSPCAVYTFTSKINKQKQKKKGIVHCFQNSLTFCATVICKNSNLHQHYASTIPSFKLCHYTFSQLLTPTSLPRTKPEVRKFVHRFIC